MPRVKIKITLPELQAYIGRSVILRTAPGGIAFQVRVINVKITFGKPRLLVIPITSFSGTGEQWVELARLRKDL